MSMHTEYYATHAQTHPKRPDLHLILTIVTTGAVARRALSAGQNVQAPLPTCTVRIIGIIFTLADSNIFVFQLFVSSNTTTISDIKFYEARHTPYE